MPRKFCSAALAENKYLQRRQQEQSYHQCGWSSCLSVAVVLGSGLSRQPSLQSSGLGSTDKPSRCLILCRRLMSLQGQLPHPHPLKSRSSLAQFVQLLAGLLALQESETSTKTMKGRASKRKMHKCQQTGKSSSKMSPLANIRAQDMQGMERTRCLVFGSDLPRLQS